MLRPTCAIMKITNELKIRKFDILKIESVKEHFPSHRIQIRVETENIHWPPPLFTTGYLLLIANSHDLVSFIVSN